MTPLLGAADPEVFSVLNADVHSRILLTADHAGRIMPACLGDLGVGAGDLLRHIAWDIGIAAVTRGLAARLDATAILQSYSRLVIDCNRQPGEASAFPEVSEATVIPGNAQLGAQEKTRRREAIFEPYHAAISGLLAARAAIAPVYVAMHSFTPVYLGVARPMQVAVLYNRNNVLARIMARLLRAEGDLMVAENEPYQVSDATDYGVPVHAERAGLDYLEIEIRQDLIQDGVGQAAWVSRLARLLPAALEILDTEKNGSAR